MWCVVMSRKVASKRKRATLSFTLRSKGAGWTPYPWTTRRKGPPLPLSSFYHLSIIFLSSFYHLSIIFLYHLSIIFLSSFYHLSIIFIIIIIILIIIIIIIILIIIIIIVIAIAILRILLVLHILAIIIIIIIMIISSSSSSSSCSSLVPSCRPTPSSSSSSFSRKVAPVYGIYIVTNPSYVANFRPKRCGELWQLRVLESYPMAPAAAAVSYVGKKGHPRPPATHLPFVSPLLKWCNVMWCNVMWCDVMWCDVMWCNVVWCNVM